MRRIARLLSIFILFTTTFIQANGQVKLRGTVTDNNTGESLIGATVILKGTTTGAVTDVNGRFEFTVPNLPPFTIVISYLGYVTQEFEIKSATEKLKFKLATDEVLINEIEVVGERLSEKQKESPLTVESMDVLAIKETPAANFYEGLGQLKGVDLTAASIGFNIVNTRGFNSTSPVRSLQIIDGVDNQSPGLNFSLGNFLGAAELDVMKVDLVVGASSAYYGPNAFNGVISMTTKNPFQFPGLSIMHKVGERNLMETGMRYAQVIKNKAGEDKFAYKINLFYMRADDWEALNMDPTPESKVGIDNPGGYDAVNRYGDENLDDSRNYAIDLTGKINTPGLGIWHRTGYLEKDLVDYNSRNLKMSLAFHYKLKPDVELIYASNFGTGTTVYQGDNRYSLKDILFLQNRLELKKKDKYFVRVYATNEDAGKSYDAVFTAFKLQETAKNDVDWSTDYRNYWNANILQGGVLPLPGFAPYQYPESVSDWISRTDSIIALYPDSLQAWHQLARDFADNQNIPYYGSPFLQPGTAEFNSKFQEITSKSSFSEGGTRFFDKSALYHVHGEYKFTPEYMDIIVGANLRIYVPNSKGTIFNDTTGIKDSSFFGRMFNAEITNYEYGFYTGLEKKVWNEKLKLNVTARLDKNENFKYYYKIFNDSVNSHFIVSPAASVVYVHNKNHIIRLSLSSAIRNPTLADQYLYYNVGRAILIGNINGIDSLVTVPSFINYISATTFNKDTLEYINIDPVRPEKVKTIEVGYRTTLFNRLYFDASYYFSYYTDFIGYKLGIDLKLNQIGFPSLFQPYRVAANADDMVTTQGFSAGLNYFFRKFYSINGNYSWNKLDKRGSDDPIIPAYNTPEHKFNIGISGRDIITNIELLTKIWNKLPEIRIRNVGFSINYKWIEEFLFEGSPQFTGIVPTYDMLDVQVSKQIPKMHTTFKLGASNILNKKQFHVYGGPYVGRLAYFSVLVELDK